MFKDRTIMILKYRTINSQFLTLRLKVWRRGDYRYQTDYLMILSSLFSTLFRLICSYMLYELWGEVFFIISYIWTSLQAFSYIVQWRHFIIVYYIQINVIKCFSKFWEYVSFSVVSEFFKSLIFIISHIIWISYLHKLYELVKNIIFIIQNIIQTSISIFVFF